MLVYSVILFVIGAALLQESILGTIVREHGIQMFCATVPWSRVVVKDWHECEGGFAVHLSILSPEGFFAMSLRPGGEIVVPVPATDARRWRSSSPDTPRTPGDRGYGAKCQGPPVPSSTAKQEAASPATIRYFGDYEIIRRVRALCFRPGRSASTGPWR